MVFTSICYAHRLLITFIYRLLLRIGPMEKKGKPKGLELLLWKTPWGGKKKERRLNILKCRRIT